MLNPFGGLKKIFSPKNALKPFKAVHKALGPKKVFNALKPKSILGKLKPRSPKKVVGSIFGKKKTAAPEQSAPAAPEQSAAPAKSFARASASQARGRTRTMGRNI